MTVKPTTSDKPPAKASAKAPNRPVEKAAAGTADKAAAGTAGRPAPKASAKSVAKPGKTTKAASPAAPPQPVTRTDISPIDTHPFDLVMFVALVSLVGLGILMTYSASAVTSAHRFGHGAYYLVRDIGYALLGGLALWIGARTDYGYWRRFAYPMLIVSIVMLAAVLVVGSRSHGAVRWFRLGPLSFQPSEPAKFAMIVWLSYSLAKKAEKVKIFAVGFLPHLIVAGGIALLLLKQPDFGTAVLLLLLTLLLLFMAGTKISYLVIAMLAAAPVGWKIVTGTPWRLRRMLAFLDPWPYRHDVGYQITESLIGVGSGGWSGLGLGEGRQKLFFLPEAHTDFILAMIGEELGLLGIVLVVLCFAVLTWRGLAAAYRSRDVFGAYLAFGITMAFSLQALVNMGVVLGSLPTKGLTLPFVSYGGSSLATTMFMAGVLLNVSARAPEPKGADTLLRAGRPKLRKNRRAPGMGKQVVIEGAA